MSSICQRQPIEALANGRHGRRIVVGQLEIERECARALHEQSHSVVFAQIRGEADRRGRHGQGRHDHLQLAVTAQWSLAGHLDPGVGVCFHSPALSDLQRAGMKLVIPLVSQGELTGLLSLGPRLSEQHYSGDDKRLLEILATQAASALRAAQLVRQQHTQAQARARIDQELQVARAIQQFFLPHTLPDITGWQIGAHYQPAHAVGGDFYDFIQLDDGRLGIVIGDVADKDVTLQRE